VPWLCARYSKRTELFDTYQRSVSMLRDLFAQKASQGAVMLAAIYLLVIAVVAGIMRVLGV